MFGTFGVLSSIRILRDAVTQTSLGYAYVNFLDIQAAAAAMDELAYRIVRNKPMRIMWSQRDPLSRRTGAGNVCVKNLSPGMTARALWETCKNMGSVLSVKIPSSGGKPLNYAYVQFENDEVAAAAINILDGMEVLGSIVSAEPYKRKEDRSNLKIWTNVFIKNFPVSWTEEKLRELCGKYGTIKSLNLPLAEDGKVSKGYGFCDFETQEEAEASVAGLNDLEVDDDAAGEAEKAARAKKAEAEKEKAKEAGETAAATEDTTDSSTTAGKVKIFAARFRSKAERQRELKAEYAIARATTGNKENSNLYVRGLPESYDEDKFRKLFSPFGSITSVKIVKDPVSGIARGYAYVAFSSREEALKAVSEMHKKAIDGKPLYINWHESKDAREQRLAQDKAKAAQQQVAPTQNRGYVSAGSMVGPQGPTGIPGQVPMGGNMFGGFPQMNPLQQSSPQGLVQQLLASNPQMAMMFLQHMLQQSAPQQQQQQQQQMQQGPQTNGLAGAVPGVGMGAQQQQIQGGPGGQMGVAGGMQLRPPTQQGPGGPSPMGAPQGQLGGQMGGRLPGMGQQQMQASGPVGQPGFLRPAPGPMVQGGAGPSVIQQQMQASQQQGMLQAQQQRSMPQQGMVGPQQQMMMNPQQRMMQQQGPGGMMNVNMPQHQLAMQQQAMQGGRPGPQMQGFVGPNMMQQQQMQMQQQQQLQMQQQQQQQQQQQKQDEKFMQDLRGAKDPKIQRQMLGEKLFPLIDSKVGQQKAGKITGMLLELDTSEVVSLIFDNGLLSTKVSEAIAVLNQADIKPAK